MNLGFLILNLAHGWDESRTIHNFQNEVRREVSANETILSYIFLIPWSRLEIWSVCGWGIGGSHLWHRAVSGSAAISRILLSCCRSQYLVVNHVYETDSRLQRIKYATPQSLRFVGARIEKKTRGKNIDSHVNATFFSQVISNVLIYF